MMQAVKEIINWYQAYYADGFYLLFAFFSYIYLFVHCPELRKKFLLPMGLIMFCVLNPILYKYVFSKIVYWRLFWMFPTAILIGTAAVQLIRSSKGKAVKLFVLAAICVLIVIKGTNVFQHGGFTKVQTFEKLPKEVQMVCDVILELEEEPRCIMPRPLLVDARQYSGEIQLMYGRNIYEYITDFTERDRLTWIQIEGLAGAYGMEKDYGVVLQYAVEEDYQFVITYEDRPIPQEILDQYGYEDISHCEGFIIYHEK